MKFQKGKLISGWGINDADYHVLITEKVVGKSKTVWKCPYYTKWYSMMNRCFSKKYQKDKVTYTNKTICEEWKYFSSFRGWMTTQDWKGKCLDKDLLVYKTTEYSPETCCFLSNEVNGFLTKRQNDRGPLTVQGLQRVIDKIQYDYDNNLTTEDF